MQKTNVRIYGKVQKVGLRVKIKDVADELGVSGTVQNMDDGSVLMTCEAEEATIQKLLDQIRANPEPATIKDMQIESSSATGMKGFKIVYGDINLEMMAAVQAGTAVLRSMSKTLNGIENTQKDILHTQKDILHTQKDILHTQKDMCDTMRSMDSKMDRSLENDEEMLKVTRSIDSKMDRSLENDEEMLKGAGPGRAYLSK